jgi:hypothetical protein
MLIEEHFMCKEFIDVVQKPEKVLSASGGLLLVR